MNFLDCTLVAEGGDVFVQFGENKLKLPAEKANDAALKDYIGKEVIAGIRPEAIHDEPMYLASLADTVIDAVVDVTELMGAEIYLYLSSEEQNMTARVSSRSTARAGDSIKVAIDMSRVHIFDKDTEKCIIH
jgi:multiple sugar transport system ATP-binding protein